MTITFVEGDKVSVQRAVDAHWEDATYESPSTGLRGWHRVRLPPGHERRINTMSGEETTPDDPQGSVTSLLIIPKRRLRFVRPAMLKLTDEQRSMIASAFVGAYDFSIDIAENKRRSLCCGGGAAMKACALIVGKRHADLLQSFFYESLGCGGWRDPEYQETQEQHFLDKIANLEEL